MYVIEVDEVLETTSENLLHVVYRSCYSVLHPAAVSLTSELDPAHPPGVLSPLLDTVLSHWSVHIPGHILVSGQHQDTSF